MELLRELSHWLIGFADSEWAVGILAAVSFTESIFFPIPPDPLLIGMSFIQQSSALWLAALVTVFSVLGALVGHWIGLKFGKPILHKIVSKKKVTRVEAMFHKYGTWAILLAAFTPIPYKVFAITAGALELERKPFIIASVIGRGARFFIIGGLIFFMGDSIQNFIETRLEILTLVLSAVLVVGLVAFYFITRRRKGNPLHPELSEVSSDD